MYHRFFSCKGEVKFPKADNATWTPCSVQYGWGLKAIRQGGPIERRFTLDLTQTVQILIYMMGSPRFVVLADVTTKPRFSRTVLLYIFSCTLGTLICFLDDDMTHSCLMKYCRYVQWHQEFSFLPCCRQLQFLLFFYLTLKS